MAILSSEAIVLSALRFGETSRIVRLALPEGGVVGAMARGAMRPKSRFGAALQVLSRGTAQLIPARSGDLHRLIAFDLLHLPMALSSGMERYAAALAVAELMQRCAPAEHHPEAYAALRQALDELEATPDDRVEPTALRALWRLVARLGFAPRLDACVVDGTPIAPAGPLPFSVREGGALCAACARSHAGNVLPPADRLDLAALLDPDAPLPALPARHAAAHRRLVGRFIEHQVAEGSRLRALEFWLDRPWATA